MQGNGCQVPGCGKVASRIQTPRDPRPVLAAGAAGLGGVRFVQVVRAFGGHHYQVVRIRMQEGANPDASGPCRCENHTEDTTDSRAVPRGYDWCFGCILEGTYKVFPCARHRHV